MTLAQSCSFISAEWTTGCDLYKSIELARRLVGSDATLKAALGTSWWDMGSS